MIRCTCGAELFSIESVCSVCIHPKPPRAIYVEDLRIKLANREEEILYWKEATEIANNENIELRAERDRLAGEVEAYESARVTWAESMRAWINRATVAERESDRLKAALKLWQDAWATGRNEPMAIAANVTRYELGGDA